jgi:hypothetical protein
MTRLGPLLSPVLIGRVALIDQAERRVADAASDMSPSLLLAGEAAISPSVPSILTREGRRTGCILGLR